MTTDDDDFPFPVNADAVRKYFVKETRWTKKENKESRQKMGIPANQEKEKGSGNS
jgi:hypothetical protein